MFYADEFDYWIIPNNQTWIIEPEPVGASKLPDDPDFEGHTSCFVSTYFECSKTQLIQFRKHGFTEKVIKYLQPEIVISEW